MTVPSQPFVFGYFPRHKYKDLIFYVKGDNGMNCELFEMPDTKENRELMEALILCPSTQSAEVVLDEIYKRLFVENHIVHPDSPEGKAIKRELAELRSQQTKEREQ